MNASRLLCAAAVLLLYGCSALQSTTSLPPSFYSLDNAQPARVAPPQPASSSAALTLVVNPPHAAAGFDSQRIVYIRKPHQLEYFAHSEWIDPPARMLGNLLVDALQRTAAFSSVVLTPGAATGELRLDSEIIRLQHDFTVHPSQVRFTLRAHLVDEKSRSVIATREFNGYANAATDDPYGGVVAANTAVQAVLADLAGFCANAAQSD